MVQKDYFDVCKTENEAKEKCVYHDLRLSAYSAKKYPSHYTHSIFNDGSEAYIVWYRLPRSEWY